MQLPRKIQAGSAARDAEDEAKARRSEGISFTPRLPYPARSPEAASREDYLRNAELRVSGGGGQKFEKRTVEPEPEPATSAPVAAPPPGNVRNFVDAFLKLLHLK